MVYEAMLNPDLCRGIARIFSADAVFFHKHAFCAVLMQKIGRKDSGNAADDQLIRPDISGKLRKLRQGRFLPN